MSHSLPGSRKLWLGGAVGVVGLAVILAVNAGADRTSTLRPAQVRFLDNGFEALGASGRMVWSHEFEPGLSKAPAAPLIVDLDGDGAAEVVVGVRFGPSGSKVRTTDAIRAFSHDGTYLWEAAPDITILCGNEAFTGPWDLRAMTASARGAGHVIWLAFVHHTWRPSFVLEVSPDSEAVVRYVQAGWILSLASWQTPSATLLAAGGVMNEQGLPSVALIDAFGPPASSPAESSRNRCSQNPTTAVRRLFLFPTLETTQPLKPYDLIEDLRPVGADLRISYKNLIALARLTPDLKLAEYAVADSYFVAHRNLERQGLLGHPADECPFVADGQEVLEWSALTGWQRLPVQMRIP
jgi:hypothetical protein